MHKNGDYHFIAQSFRCNYHANQGLKSGGTSTYTYTPSNHKTQRTYYHLSDKMLSIMANTSNRHGILKIDNVEGANFTSYNTENR